VGMKAFFFIAVIWLCLSGFSFSQNYKQVKVYLQNPGDVITLSLTGVDPEDGYKTKDNAFIFFMDSEEFAKLQISRLRFEILIDDWFGYYNSLPDLTTQQKENILQQSKNNFNIDGFGFGSMGGFYTYAEVAANLDSMHSQYPNLITQKYSIGTTVEGRTIWAVKISDTPNVTENEPAVGYDALIHAREPVSMSSLLYFMWYLLENYGTDPVATYLVNNREIYCVPVYNADGYEYNHQTYPNGGGMWRKNRRNNGSGCYGIDLNRNYSYQWGYDNIGSSPDPCDETYRGTGPFSEPESQAIRDFIVGKNMQTYFNMHAYGNDLLYPWGYINQACQDEDTYLDFCIDMTKGNGFVYGTGGYILGYNSNGAARDWLYGNQTIKNKIYGYTEEIGTADDYFWPSQSRIFPIVQNTLGTLIYNSLVAGGYLMLGNPNFSNEYFLPSSFVQLTPEYFNKGLATAYNVKVELSSTSPYINTKTFFVTADSIEARNNATLYPPLSFLILNTAPAEEQIPIILTASINNEVVSADTINIIIGYPEYVFQDTTDDPAILWDINSTPANPHWEATTSTFYSPPTCFTDSKSGNYSNNATVTMTLANAIDLSGYSNPRLSFRTKFDLEQGYDYGQVEVSSNNGNTWIPLQGEYTIPGSGDFQPPGEPIYNGTQTNWVQEEISLASYISSQVKLRFELKSDYGITADGWYLDDIGVKVYTAVPVELTSFTAVPKDGEVVLNWITATETNNEGFEIQSKKSTASSQKTEWEKIGFVEGKGTTTKTNSYSFIDENFSDGKIYYRLKQIDYNGTYKIYGPVEVNIGLPLTFNLEQNYPNPFNPTTTISFKIKEKGQVSLKVYNLLGMEVATIVNEIKTAGIYSVKFNGNNLPSGVYFYRLNAGNFTATKKLILLK
jgi:carboxypeptidase T